MLSFITSQAMALSQVKAKDGEPPNASQDQVGAAPQRRKSFFKRLLQALVEPRRPKPRFGTEGHARTEKDGTHA